MLRNSVNRDYEPIVHESRASVYYVVAVLLPRRQSESRADRLLLKRSWLELCFCALTTSVSKGRDARAVVQAASGAVRCG